VWRTVPEAYVGVHDVRSHIITTGDWPDSMWALEVRSDLEAAHDQLATRLGAVERGAMPRKRGRSGASAPTACT
jgi:hypothetical protein